MDNGGKLTEFDGTLTDFLYSLPRLDGMQKGDFEYEFSRFLSPRIELFRGGSAVAAPGIRDYLSNGPVVRRIGYWFADEVRKADAPVNPHNLMDQRGFQADEKFGFNFYNIAAFALRHSLKSFKELGILKSIKDSPVSELREEFQFGSADGFDVKYRRLINADPLAALYIHRARREELAKRAAELGMEHDEFNELNRRLKETGAIFEPERGVFQAV